MSKKQKKPTIEITNSLRESRAEAPLLRTDDPREHVIVRFPCGTALEIAVAGDHSITVRGKTDTVISIVPCASNMFVVKTAVIR